MSSAAFSSFDHAAMRRALELAELGLRSAHPNPRVGCVIAAGGQIIGEGWHERAGAPHAEAHALQQAGTRARGATAYVTLEPCSHFGRTPPCANALIEAGIARVVYAVGDPDPRVNGSGAERLRAAGVSVEAGLLVAEATELNRGFFSRLQRGRPWVRVKMAQSLDGRTALANGESRWLTGPAAREDVHRWRAQCGAILTGVGTATIDDPSLTVRIAGEQASRQPLRVVVDSHLRLPVTAKLLCEPGETLIATTATPAAVDRFLAAVPPGAMVTVERLPGDSAGRVDLAALLGQLARLGINDVWVEAGAKLSGALQSAGVVDEWLLYLAPLLLGQDARPLLALNGPATLAEAARLAPHDVRLFGPDIRIILRAAGG